MTPTAQITRCLTSPKTPAEISKSTGIPLGNVIAVLIARKQFVRLADGKWRLKRWQE